MRMHILSRLALLCAVASPMAYGQNHTYWTGGSGNAHDPNHWTDGVPNLGFEAHFGLDGQRTVSLGGSQTLLCDRTHIEAGGWVLRDGELRCEAWASGWRSFVLAPHPGQSAFVEIQDAIIYSRGVSDIALGAFSNATLHLRGSNVEFRHHPGGGGAWFAVGSRGRGTLLVDQGASLDARTLFVVGDFFSGTGGSATVSGSGSSIASYDMTIGKRCPGELIVENGATATSDRYFVVGALTDGEDARASGSVVVRGTGSLLRAGTSKGGAFIGNWASGHVQVADGGALETDARFYVGYREGSDGALYVSGPDSRVEISGETSPGFVIGQHGKGTCHIEGGGRLIVSERITLGEDIRSDGELVVRDTGSLIQARGLDIDSGAQLKVESGGRLSLEESLVANDATIQLRGGMIETPILDNANGAVLGSGTVSGDLRNNGILRPDVSLSGLGNFEQTEGGLLSLSIAGPDSEDYGVLDIEGHAELAGALWIDIDVDYFPSVGTEFEVLTYNSRTGEFDDLIVVDGGRVFDLLPIYLDQSLILRVREPIQSRVFLGNENVPLQGIDIIATHAETGEEIHGETDDDGSYALVSPSPGPYTIKAILDYQEPATEQRYEIVGYPGGVIGETYALGEESDPEIPAVTFPWPVILQGGLFGGTSTWEFALDYLSADPALHADKSKPSPPIPAFLGFPMPNILEEFPEGYINLPVGDHRLNSQKLRKWIHGPVRQSLIDAGVSPTDLDAIAYSFVGHSMGGIITRGLVTSFGSPKTHRVVSLDAVHGGTWYAQIGGLVCNLSVSYMNGVSPWCATPPIFAWNKEWNRVTDPDRWLLFADRGGIVLPDASAFGVGEVWDTFSPRVCDTEDWVAGRDRLVDFGHSQIHDEDCVLRESTLFLLGRWEGEVCKAPAGSGSAPYPKGHVSGTLAAASGDLEPATFEVDSSDPLRARFLRHGVDATYSVLGPDGSTLPLENLTTEQMAENVFMETFDISTPPVGSLSLELKAGNEDALLDWNFYFENGTYLAASTDVNGIGSGQPVTVLASLNDLNDEILTGETPSFIAGVFSPGTATPATVLLFDDGLHGDGSAGDGLFGGVFQGTNDEGIYFVSIQGEATFGGPITQRHGETSFSVLPTGATILGAPIEETSDPDGDGFIDELRFKFRVSIEATGSYDLAASLKDSQQNLMAKTNAPIEDLTVPGEYWFELSFQGEGLSRLNIDGPWFLDDITLYRTDKDSLPVDAAPTHVTQAYLAANFERPSWPTLTTVVPDHGNFLGGQFVMLYGEGLQDVTEVRFGDVAVEFTITGDDTIQVTVPKRPRRFGTAGPLAEETVDITIVSPWGTTVLHERFRYVPR